MKYEVTFYVKKTGKDKKQDDDLGYKLSVYEKFQGCLWKNALKVTFIGTRKGLEKAIKQYIRIHNLIDRYVVKCCV